MPHQINNARILVIDDDPYFTDFIKTCLEVDHLDCCRTGEIIERQNTVRDWDLIILDIELESATGFEVCRKIRALDKYIPILFISGMSDLESRLNAYGAGGNDYISKPFQCDELCYKVSSLLQLSEVSNQLSEELTNATELVHNTQVDASNLQIVNRFVLTSARCKDFNSLFTVAIHAMKELGVHGLLCIDQHGCHATSGSATRLEQEILDMSAMLPRIHSFGKRRALFRWRNCRLLVRNIGGLIDTLAILMDAIELSVDRLNSEQNLLDQTYALQAACRNGKNRISELFETMTETISNELLVLGIVSSITFEEEERIQSLMNEYKAHVQNCLNEQDALNTRMYQIIEGMRSESDDFKAFLEKIKQSPEEADESVELF